MATTFNLVPFDPIKAMNGASVFNKKGDEFKVLCIDAPSDQPVIAMNLATGAASNYNLDGKAHLFPKRDPSELDLFMEVTLHTAYITERQFEELTLYATKPFGDAVKIIWGDK